MVFSEVFKIMVKEILSSFSGANRSNHPLDPPLLFPPSAHSTKNMILFQDNQPPILATSFAYHSHSLQQIYKRDVTCCSTQCQLSYKIQRCHFLQKTLTTIQSHKIKLLIWNHGMSPACQILEPFLPALIKLIHERSVHFHSKWGISRTICIGTNRKTSLNNFFNSNFIN